MECNIHCEDTWLTTKYSMHTRLKLRVGKDKIATSNSLSTSYFQSYSHMCCMCTTQHVHQRQNSHEPSRVIGWRDEETRPKSFIPPMKPESDSWLYQFCSTLPNIFLSSVILLYESPPTTPFFYQSRQQTHAHTLSTCMYSLPWHSGWVPSQVPLFMQVLSGEPFSM